MKTYFYKIENHEISAVTDIDINKKVKKRLAKIYQNRVELAIPDDHIKNWDNVALYDPSASVENALSIVVKTIEGGYHLKNKLNDLTGKEWIKLTCSMFIFNALKEHLINNEIKKDKK